MQTDFLAVFTVQRQIKAKDSSGCIKIYQIPVQPIKMAINLFGNYPVEMRPAKNIANALDSSYSSFAGAAAIKTRDI